WRTAEAGLRGRRSRPSSTMGGPTSLPTSEPPRSRRRSPALFTGRGIQRITRASPFAPVAETFPSPKPLWRNSEEALLKHSYMLLSTRISGEMIKDLSRISSSMSSSLRSRVLDYTSLESGSSVDPGMQCWTEIEIASIQLPVPQHPPPNRPSSRGPVEPRRRYSQIITDGDRRAVIAIEQKEGRTGLGPSMKQ